jgi:hypothetical protein
MLYRKHLNDNIYEQSEWGLMVIKLIIGFGELVKVALKGGWKKGWECWGRSMRATGFCGPFVCLGMFVL